jgi:hypothetical protein
LIGESMLGFSRGCAAKGEGLVKGEGAAKGGRAYTTYSTRMVDIKANKKASAVQATRSVTKL